MVDIVGTSNHFMYAILYLFSGCVCGLLGCFFYILRTQAESIIGKSIIEFVGVILATLFFIFIGYYINNLVIRAYTITMFVLGLTFTTAILYKMCKKIYIKNKLFFSKISQKIKKINTQNRLTPKDNSSIINNTTINDELAQTKGHAKTQTNRERRKVKVRKS